MKGSFTKHTPGAERLDQFLSKQAPDYSRSFFLHHIRSEGALVNGVLIKKSSFIIKPEDTVEIDFSPLDSALQANASIYLDIIYEDEDTIVINKQKGQIVHPGSGEQSKTESVVNALLARDDFYRVKRDPTEPDNLRPGIVHRLDKDTTGVLLVAKHDLALSYYSKQFEARTVAKKYLAIVHGIPESEHGIIDAPLGRSLHDRKKMSIMPQGKAAKTEFDLLGSYKERSLLHVTLHTGRTHQIRVHLASIKLPILGDITYGIDTNTEGGHALHSSSLTFDLYKTKKPFTAIAGISEGFDRALEETYLMDVLPQNLRYNHFKDSSL